MHNTELPDFGNEMRPPADYGDDTESSPARSRQLTEPAAGQAQPLAEIPVATSGSSASDPKPREIGGPKGPEPTRYGDWEKGGRCIDF